jgi:biotin carboxyl carrier protein
VSDEPTIQRATDAARSDGPDLDDLTNEVLPALIARLRASHLGELEVGGDGWRVRLRRASGHSRDRGDGFSAPPGAGHPVAPADSSVARSPGVGYFQPAADLFMGAPVQVGDTLGSVDVLGIAQDVSAPVGGIVSRVLAETGQAVEYGQGLVDIDPLAAAGSDPDALDEAGS